MYKNIVYAIVIFIALRFMDFNQTTTAMWISPYLSSAVNFDWSNFSLLVNMDEVKIFSHLAQEQFFSYHFIRTDNLIDYNYLAKGLVITLIFSKKIFFWMGDLEALQYLQYIVHIGISLLILDIFKENYKKLLFFFLYAVNPLVLYFVNYPYYYFWQVVPSVIFIYWYFKRDISLFMLVIFTVIFSYIYITRPTVLFLIILFYVSYSLQNSLKRGAIAFGLFIVLINIAPNLSIGPWHTMYVGVGAYENKYNIKLSDEEGYKYYKQQTGKIVNSGNIMYSNIKDDYYKVLKNRYFEIIKESPIMIIKHALLNIFESYSIGYKVGNPKIVYISALIGIFMMFLLLYTKQYIIFLAIGFAGGAFTPYFPPIGAYMYGSYILIIVGFIGIVEYFVKNRGLNEK
jgi:hypothetical protein